MTSGDGKFYISSYKYTWNNVLLYTKILEGLQHKLGELQPLSTIAGVAIACYEQYNTSTNERTNVLFSDHKRAC